MRLTVNGKQLEVEQAATIHDLLSMYNLQEKIVIVEKNGEIVERSLYQTTAVADGDRLEIVHFVGGG